MYFRQFKRLEEIVIHSSYWIDTGRVIEIIESLDLFCLTFGESGYGSGELRYHLNDRTNNFCIRWLQQILLISLVLVPIIIPFI